MGDVLESNDSRQRGFLAEQRVEPTAIPRLWCEIALVLGLSLGASAVYAIVDLVGALTATTALANQTTALNPSLSPREWLDFTYQFLNLFFDLFAVGLCLYLLWTPGRSPFRRIGFDLTRPWRDLSSGWLLVAVIGIPGLAFFILGRLLGLNVNVEAAPLSGYWWTIPLLVFSAIRAGLQEEVIVIGYLFTRLRQVGWNTWTIIIACALLRGSYHLYQGVGPFFGNAAMGVVFGWCYSRWGRVMPLVVAHSILDILSFVGYPLAVALWPHVFVA